jgi:hypothetical protein
MKLKDIENASTDSLLKEEEKLRTKLVDVLLPKHSKELMKLATLLEINRELTKREFE